MSLSVLTLRQSVLIGRFRLGGIHHYHGVPKPDKAMCLGVTQSSRCEASSMSCRALIKVPRGRRYSIVGLRMEESE